MKEPDFLLYLVHFTSHTRVSKESKLLLLLDNHPSHRVGSSCSPGEQHPGVTTTLARRKYSGVTEVIYTQNIYTPLNRKPKMNHGKRHASPQKIVVHSTA
ncbi:unnamed protein product [Boreogadus saida]